MPTLNATPHTVLPYMFVDTNWADVPAATCVQVVRVHTDTGAATPLRAYVAPCGGSDGCMTLSGGKAFFWDTELPLDTQFHYEARACNQTILYTPSPPAFLDTFSRVTAASWGSPDTGPAWTVSGGAAADYSVSAGRGNFSMGTVNVTRTATSAVGIADFDLTVGRIALPAVPTGATIEVGFRMRIVGGDFVDARLFFATTDTVTVSTRQFVSGVDTGAGFPPVPAVTTTTPLSLRFQGVGSQLRVWVWAAGTPQPTNPNVTLTTTYFAAGDLQVNAILGAGNTNTLPYLITFDDITINPQTQTELVVSTDPTAIASDGDFWLKDPVRPCNDQRVLVDFMGSPNCPPGRGIFFVTMGTETREPNAVDVLPTNAVLPITVSQARRDVTSVLVLATRSFTDRDALVAELAPGGPLLFQGPPNYGIPDRYISVQSVDVARGLPDIRYQTRIFTLPFTATQRAAGTTQGICGSRFQDLCDVYSSWAAMEIAGLTYLDLITGAATGAVPLNFRTWDEVNAEFADWDAVLANGTWQELLDGD